MTHPVPHFICIGAQRAGTTWLYETLSRHPEIFLPPIKELHYFDSIDPDAPIGYRFHERGYRLRRKAKTFARSLTTILTGRAHHPGILLDFWRHYFLGDGSIDWYQRLFQTAARAGKVTGEITPAYALLSPPYIARLQQLNPQLKLIYILRNPIDRAFSQATKDLIRRKGVKAHQVSEAELIAFLKSEVCYGRSDYLTTLKKFRQHVDGDRLMVCFFDDIQANPQRLINQVCQFIGVSPLHPQTRLDTQVNSSSHLMGKMPEAIATTLVNQYAPLLRELAAEIGGPTQHWYAQVVNYQADSAPMPPS
ncbi:MAG: sulfotransferase domain-containing protein [Synechococcales bacterium]|nr:sulfotransferase domain-containing protein [Synechococcales bacterium]